MSVDTANQKRIDAESENDVHYHRMGERCWCGYLSVPSRFYVKSYQEVKLKNKTRVEPVLCGQEEAEAAYLAWLRTGPEHVNPPVMAELSHPGPAKKDVPPSMSHPCATCGADKDYKGRECYGCRKKRQRSE